MIPGGALNGDGESDQWPISEGIGDRGVLERMGDSQSPMADWESIPGRNLF